MPYEKKLYKKFNGKGKTTLNPEPLTLNQGRPEPKHKRGKLASLMSEEAKATASIHELSYDFAYLNARSLPPDNIGKAANLE